MSGRACPVCGGQPRRGWSLAALKAIYRCLTCGVEWFDPAGYPSSHRDQYARDGSSRSTYYTSSADCDRLGFDGRVERLIAQSGRARGRVLDVGCSVGTFLEAAAARGWDAVGIEPNPAAAAGARARGRHVVVGYFDTQTACGLGEFDAVHMSDVIEHVFDPVQMLKAARTVLKPGGVLLVTTPDFDTLCGRALQRKPAEHVVHFRRGALAEAAARAGFEGISVERIERRRSLAALQHSTTFGPVGKAALRMSAGIGATGAVERLIAPLFRDTLLLSARRPPIRHDQTAH